MQKWIVKISLDRGIVMEDMVKALDYTKAYLETAYKYPLSANIISVERVCGAYDEETNSCQIPDVYHGVVCPLMRKDHDPT